MRCSKIAWAVLCMVPFVSAAQDTSRLIIEGGGGFSQPVGNSGGRFNTGFNLQAGAGVNLFSRLGVLGEFGYNEFGLTDGALAAAGVPGGTGRIYSVTLNPVFRFNPHGRFDAYLMGGGGYYRRTIEFTKPVLAAVTVFDPFLFGFVTVPVAANQVLASFTQNKAGWNAGAGVTFRLSEDSRTKLFAESRYHYIYTTPVRTTILPVTFGLRW
ncbi:MAG: outer membrane beta-barrel protein [Acidobacteriota bacterium]